MDVRTFPAWTADLANYEWLANFLVSLIQVVLCVLLLKYSSKVCQTGIGLMLAQFQPIGVNTSVGVELFGMRVGVLKTVASNRLDFLLRLLLIDDHLHLVRPEYFNTD